jgi:hypothetical protein
MKQKEKKEFVEETAEEKSARWAKNCKNAMKFAKQAGINLKSVSRERKKIEQEKQQLKLQRQFF